MMQYQNNNNRINWLVTTLVLAILISPQHGITMSIFSSESVCIFSAIKGNITYKGAPAVGATLKRTVTWKGEPGDSDTTSTDKTGNFQFGSMFRNLKQVFPAEFVAHQTIYVQYQDKEFLIWEMAKRDRNEYGELGGIPSNFRCELTDEPDGADVPRGLLLTSCKWDNIKK